MMARKTTGKIIETRTQKGTSYALRFQANGKRHFVTLGASSEGWDHKQAEAALRHTLADVERGTWQPLRREPVGADDTDRDPTFYDFARRWYEDNRGAWRKATRLDYTWQLNKHLIPFFGHHRLSQITVATVNRYRATKVLRVEQGTLSATSVNKTITRLGQILELAVEEGLIERNPATGKRRRLRAPKPAPIWLDSAEHIGALLDAAGELDREAKSNGKVPRRAILSTLVFSGLRIGELIELRWRDVNLADGRITVRASKTDAGVRRVDLLPVLSDVLGTHKAGVRAHADELVFPTQAGGPMNPSNVRNRILTPAVGRANKRLQKAGATALPEGLTPHKLRHTFTSLLVALGTDLDLDPGAIMEQLGHSDPTFTLRVYRHGMRRDEDSKAQLQALVGVAVAADSGSNGIIESPAGPVESNGHSAQLAY
jgi:integrase